MDGIKEFFRPTELNGENQMYCDRCGHKVDATITDVIKHHPDVLILLLKRCEFNYHYMSYVKTRCSVEVPYTLQIPESQTYELYAVVDHLGDLRGGHYTATIRIPEEHEDTWYNFNDTSGTRLYYQPFQVDNTEKSESAYLLFYRKKHAATEELMEMHTNQSLRPSNTNNSDQCQEVGNEAEEADVRKNAAVNFSVIKNGETITGDKTLLFKNTPLQEDVRGHENVGQAIVNYDFILKVTDKPAVQDHVNNQDERIDGQKGQMDLIPERDEQTEKEEEPLTKHRNSHKDYQGDEGSDSVRQDTGEYEGGTQNIGKHYSLKYASVEAYKQTTGEIRLLPEYGSQDDQTGSDRMQIVPKGNNQWQKQGDSSRFLIGRIEKEVKGDTSVHNVIYSTHKDIGVETLTRDVRDDRWEQKGADTYFQRSKITKEKPDHSEAVKLESMRLEDVGQKTTEKIISVTHISQSVGGVEIWSKAQQNEGDSKQNQSEGNRTLKERLTEKQGADNNENVRLESFQPNARSGFQGVTEGGRHSKKPSLRVRVIDEEHTEILSASKHSSKSKTIIRITLDETVQDATKWQESQRNIRRSLNI